MVARGTISVLVFVSVVALFIVNPVQGLAFRSSDAQPEAIRLLSKFRASVPNTSDDIIFILPYDVSKFNWTTFSSGLARGLNVSASQVTLKSAVQDTNSTKATLNLHSTGSTTVSELVEKLTLMAESTRCTPFCPNSDSFQALRCAVGNVQSIQIGSGPVILVPFFNTCQSPRTDSGGGLPNFIIIICAVIGAVFVAALIFVVVKVVRDATRKAEPYVLPPLPTFVPEHATQMAEIGPSTTAAETNQQISDWWHGRTAVNPRVYV